MNIKIEKLLVVLALAGIVSFVGWNSLATDNGAGGSSDHPRDPRTLVMGELEDWDKTPQPNRGDAARYAKVSVYGSLWTEQVQGQLLKQISPPPEPGDPAWWVIPDSHNPRVMYGEGDSVNDGARILIEYNVSGEVGHSVTNEVFVPAGIPRPIQGAIKIASSAGTVSIYGFYTKPVVQDE